MRPSHHQRLVKIFSADENGVSRPACTFVAPLDAGRLLDSPRQAARFVSLIPLERTGSVGGGGAGGGRLEQWSNTHSFLCRVCDLSRLTVQRAGDVEDHAILLCSLLLGFGLRSFVCIGTKRTSADGAFPSVVHAWVATIADGSVVFWESLSAER